MGTSSGTCTGLGSGQEVTTVCIVCVMCVVCDLLGDVVALPHGLQLAALHRALHHHRLGLVTARQLALLTHSASVSFIIIYYV